jgi:protoporphyrinogen oxidase
MKENKTIYIIGGGVSGLIAAYELEQAGYFPKIIEQTAEVGGRVKTLQEKGYALDLGFQVLLSSYPMVNKYLDVDALNLIKLEPGALIYVNGKAISIGDPLRNWKMLIPTVFADIGSLSDKFKILKLNYRLKKKSIQNIFDSPETSTLQYLIQLGFSSKIIDCFFKPFFAGIFLEPSLKTSSRMFEFVYKMFGDGYATIPKLGIGAISNQLKSKLHQTEFIFNSEVKKITNDFILMRNGEKISHEGLILASNSTSIVTSVKDQDKEWKSCMCIYFEVDHTNIPEHTIALIADEDNYANNLFAYKDHTSRKTILSVTSIELGKSEQEIIYKITNEIKKYTGATIVNYIHHYNIKQALPDIQNLRMTIQLNETQLLENIFLAGDTLLNGSLNAAMESGQLAAKALIKQSK